MQKNLQIWIYVILLLVLSIPGWSQCPQPTFTIPDTVCINEPFNITNTSTGAMRYKWEFCPDKLNKQPAWNTTSFSLNGAVIPTDIETILVDGQWYSFICSRNNNKLIRLDFGSNLDNIPTIVDLGNINGLLQFPNGIKFRKEGSNWYALLVNVAGDFTNSLLRLDFGNSITNIPSATNLANISSELNNPRSIDIAEDKGNIIAIIPNYGNNTVSIINFGNSLNNIPQRSNLITVTGFYTNSGLWDITINKSCNQWYAFIIGYNSALYRLDFGENLFDTPSITVLNDLVAEVNRIVEIEIEQENGDFYGFIVTELGRFYRFQLDKELSFNSFSLEQLLTSGQFNDADGFDLVKTETAYKALIVDWGENKLKQATFSGNCLANIVASTEENPSNVSYSGEGMQRITLTAFNSNGNTSSYKDSVFVRPPMPADFMATYLCEGAATKFTAPVAPLGNRVKAWYWEFGDGSTSSTETPEHLFNGAGAKNVKLTITDVCNKTTTITKAITIYQSTTLDFTIPTEICSSQLITFMETSSVKNDTTVAWEWDFGNGERSTESEPVYAFPEVGNFTITLTITGKSGCNTSIAKGIQVKPGAQVDFAVYNACLGNATAFTDLTKFPNVASFVSRIWTFGDGETSQLANPVHIYQAAGNHTVTLTVENNLGCSVSYSKTIAVTLLPQPAFSFSIACTGETTSFFDETTIQKGQVVSWGWNFGEPESGSANFSDQRNPMHIFTREGNYTVTLKVETIYGCIDSLSRIVQVISSPQSNFTYQLNCENREVTFTDQTVTTVDNPVTGWYWDFGDGNNSLLPQPVHTYMVPGEYTVTLVATALSRCTHNYSQVVRVGKKPAADFNLSGMLCTNNTLVFTDKSVVDATDYIISREWDFD